MQSRFALADAVPASRGARDSGAVSEAGVLLLEHSEQRALVPTRAHRRHRSLRGRPTCGVLSHEAQLSPASQRPPWITGPRHWGAQVRSRSAHLFSGLVTSLKNHSCPFTDEVLERSRLISIFPAASGCGSVKQPGPTAQPGDGHSAGHQQGPGPDGTRCLWSLRAPAGEGGTRGSKRTVRQAAVPPSLCVHGPRHRCPSQDGSPRDLHPPAWGPHSDRSPTICRTPPLQPAPSPVPCSMGSNGPGAGGGRRGQGAASQLPRRRATLPANCPRQWRE